MILKTIKGFFIGISAVVPGLSASIFAIVVGLYEALLFAVSDLKNDFWKHVKFLLPIGIGVGIGVLVSVDIMLAITERFPAYSYLFFAGLVIGSIPMIVSKFKDTENHLKGTNIIWLFLAFAIVVIMASSTGDGEHIGLYRINGVVDFLLILAVGAISISLMVLPGVSGSLILIVLGHFGTVYNALSQFGNSLTSFLSGDTEAAFEAFYTVFILVPFAIGAIIGLLSISKLMSWLLKRYEVPTYYAVLGTLLATIWILIDMGVISYMPFRGDLGGSIVFVIIGLICVIVGYLCTRFLDKK